MAPLHADPWNAPETAAGFAQSSPNETLVRFAAAEPLPGETFVFTEFSGRPQVFLTAEQLVAELEACGFVPDAAVPLTEHNVRPGSSRTAGRPVIYEAGFRFTGPAQIELY